MKTNTFLIMTILGSTKVDASYKAYRPVMSQEQSGLKPGWVTSCESSFVIENVGDGQAEIKIILGIQEFWEDRISAQGKMAYDLRQSFAFAKQLGKTVNMDDVALSVMTVRTSRYEFSVNFKPYNQRKCK